MNRKNNILIMLILVFPYLLFSQNLGISISKINTNNYELENPFGLSFYLSQKLIKNNFLKLEYIYNQNTRIYEGFIEYKLFTNPPELRLYEKIESKSYIHNIEISLYHPVIKLYKNKLGIGIGLNKSTLNGLRIGSDFNKKQNLKRIDKFGYFVYLFFDFGKLKDTPIHFNIIAKYKYLFDSGITTDIENTFNKDMKIIELQLGLAYYLKN